MSDENTEKQLGDDIDRMIAGGPSNKKEVSSEDYEKNVQFARKMLDSRAEPTPAFREKLRKQLLTKLVEEEMEAERTPAHSFWARIQNLVPRSPAWRTVTATIAVFVLVFVVIWQLGVFNQTTSPPLMTTSQPPAVTSTGPVEITASTSQATYKIGETVDINCVFINKSRESVTIKNYPPQIIIAAASLTPYKNFTGGQSKILESGETLEYKITWDQVDNEGKQVPAGDYVINMLDIELVSGEVITLSESPRITIIAP
jgi:hypothetical protein